MPKVITAKQREELKAEKERKDAALKQALAKPTNRKVIYPTFEVFNCFGEHAITVDMAKEMLGWETEAEFIERTAKEHPDIDKDLIKLQDPMFKDEEGNKIVCWNSDMNRPFDESHARKLAQDILNRNWAGPTTMPGETVNGETIIIGRTGQVGSGNHRLIGLVLAGQLWKKQIRHWEHWWATEPILESLLVRGVSESPKVIQTLDNVKPRSLSDVFYTSDIFKDLNSNVERKECARMLQSAVDFLWKRTDAATIDSWQKHQTHSTSMGFLDRHQKLLECVRFMFERNKERVISNMRLSAGQCAAMMYLMGSCKSDGDVYRNADPLPNESVLDWYYEQRAKDFWTLLSVRNEHMTPIIRELGALVDEDSGSGGRLSEKAVILAKAWKFYRQTEHFKDEDIRPDYTTNEQTGNTVLTDNTTFGGIDQGRKVRVEPTVTTDEVDNARAEARARQAAQLNAKLEALRGGKRAEGEVPVVKDPKFDDKGMPPAPKLLKQPLNKSNGKPATAAAPTSKPAPATPKASTAIPASPTPKKGAAAPAPGTASPKPAPKPAPGKKKPTSK